MGLSMSRSNTALRHRIVSLLALALLLRLQPRRRLRDDDCVPIEGGLGGAKAQERTMSIPSMMLGPGLAGFPGFRCNGGVAAQYQAQAHFIRSCPF